MLVVVAGGVLGDVSGFGLLSGFLFDDLHRALLLEPFPLLLRGLRGLGLGSIL
jgi:hypothetical protein